MKQLEAIAGMTGADLEALLERHGLGALSSVEVLRGGISNVMLRVNDELVVRFPIRDFEVPKLPWEALIYRRLQREAGMAGPQVLALDSSRELVPFDVLVLSWVDGVAGNSVWPSLSEAEQEVLSEDLGRRIGAIHALRWPAYGERGRGLQGIESPRWADIVFSKTVRAYERAVALELFAPRKLDSILTMLNDGEAIFDAASAPALVHTDLTLANVLLRQVEGSWIVASIGDWEDAMVADAAWEFADLGSPRYGEAAYPMVGAFTYGYRERHVVAGDLQVRRRLYRLLHFFEHAVRCAEQLGPTAPRTLHNIRLVERLLQAR